MSQEGRIEMSQAERDVLSVMTPVVAGERSRKQKRVGTRTANTDPLAYSRPPGAQVALLRSPILPDGESHGSPDDRKRPADNHPWRKWPINPKRTIEPKPDISIVDK